MARKSAPAAEGRWSWQKRPTERIKRSCELPVDTVSPYFNSDDADIILASTSSEKFHSYDAAHILRSRQRLQETPSHQATEEEEEWDGDANGEEVAWRNASEQWVPGGASDWQRGSTDPLKSAERTVSVPVGRVFFRVHRAKLALSSSTFRDMFELASEDSEEKDSNGLVTIQLDDGVDSLDLLLRFIYAEQALDCPSLRDDTYDAPMILDFWNVAIKYGQNTAACRAEDQLYRFLGEDSWDSYNAQPLVFRQAVIHGYERLAEFAITNCLARAGDFLDEATMADVGIQWTRRLVNAHLMWWSRSVEVQFYEQFDGIEASAETTFPQLKQLIKERKASLLLPEYQIERSDMFRTTQPREIRNGVGHNLRMNAYG